MNIAQYPTTSRTTATQAPRTPKFTSNPLKFGRDAIFERATPYEGLENPKDQKRLKALKALLKANTSLAAVILAPENCSGDI